MLETESRYRHKDSKRLYYLSMEFLMGRSLGDNLSNLRVEDSAARCWPASASAWTRCWKARTMPAWATAAWAVWPLAFWSRWRRSGMPGFGYGIDYEYGLFKQEIFNGFQREKPDRWKAERHAVSDRASGRSGQHPALREGRRAARGRRQPGADLVGPRRSWSAFRPTCRLSAIWGRR